VSGSGIAKELSSAIDLSELIKDPEPDLLAERTVKVIDVVRNATANIQVSFVIAVAAARPDINPPSDPPEEPSPPPSDL